MFCLRLQNKHLIVHNLLGPKKKKIKFKIGLLFYIFKIYKNKFNILNLYFTYKQIL